MIVVGKPVGQGAEWVMLKCDTDGCSSVYRPRPKAFDVTTSAAEREELEGALRLRASRQGWSSLRVFPDPWCDCCPAHKVRPTGVI